MHMVTVLCNMGMWVIVGIFVWAWWIITWHAEQHHMDQEDRLRAQRSLGTPR